MSEHRYNTQKVCARQIRFQLEDGRLHKVQFLGGGCEGNLRVLSKLIEGADAHTAAEMLRGTPCGKRGTSCGDQLAQAIDRALEEARQSA